MMGGRVIDVDSKPTSPSNIERTSVLVGRTGNGKSVMANSILRRRAFKSRTRGLAQRWPRLFDSLAGSEFVGKEIVNRLGANKTKDAAKRTEQVGKLLSVVDSVIVQNGGQPYTDKIFAGLKLKETTTRLEHQLAEEHLARLKAEGAAQLAQMKKFLSLERNLERA
ncbi:hypothetical protein WN944_014789 [Citrus x changshan-huyou]|uniref:AIG1-type G domain-containing protein n=1 Tax=Citrus x changshan-huyou TaxID=2935761 RepID=A0AAP0QQF4_9ROSI